MSKVSFSHAAAYAGVIGGVLIAVGVSAVVLLTPQPIEGSARCILTIIALIAGGIITLVSAFFGIVIPKEAETAKKTKSSSPAASDDEDAAPKA